MIRRCEDADFGAVWAIINEAAQAYHGVIPADCWKEPYMPEEELRREMAQGVIFWGVEENNVLVGVMGIQQVADVTLIRHAYVHPAFQRRGIGGTLLTFLRGLTTRPILIGTWADAWWAIQFYQQRGFRVVSPDEKDRLLRTYWKVPPRQIETSVVLADVAWFEGVR